MFIRKSLIAIVFLCCIFGCKKENIEFTISSKNIENIAPAPNPELIEKDKEFIQSLIKSSKSEKIKAWLSVEPVEASIDKSLQIINSFSYEDTQEFSEIFTQLAYFSLAYRDLSDTELKIAKQEIEEAGKQRYQFNELLYKKHKTTIWDVSEAQLLSLQISDNTAISRGCSSNKRHFGNSARLTKPVPFRSNCKGSNDVKSCRTTRRWGLSNCDSDCDWEFKFEGKQKTIRTRFSFWSLSSFHVANGLYAIYNAVGWNNMAIRYGYENGKFHTYLLHGSSLLEKSSYTSWIGRTTLKGYLSMDD